MLSLKAVVPGQADILLVGEENLGKAASSKTKRDQNRHANNATLRLKRAVANGKTSEGGDATDPQKRRFD